MKENIQAKSLGGQSELPKSKGRGFPGLAMAEQLGLD